MASSPPTAPNEPARRRGVAPMGVVAAWLLFIGAFAPITEYGGTGAAALVVFIPVGATAWAYGLRAGLIAGAIAYPANMVLLIWIDGSFNDMIDIGFVIGHTVLVVFAGVVGYSRDVSSRYRAELRERHRIEQILAASEEQFRVAFEDAPTGIAVVGNDGVVTRSNRTFGVMVGSPDPLHTSFESFFEDPSSWKQLLASLVAGDIEVGEGEFATACGASRWVAVVANVIHGSRGVIGVLCHVQDVTERVEAGLRLEQLVRSKDEFVASVSHELRTPLTAVLGFAQMLRTPDAADDSETTGEYVSAIVDQASELSAIVEDLLVAARADIGTIALQRERLVLRDVIDPMIADHERRGAAPIAVTGDAQVLADRTRLRQILRNLISNAERYGGPHIRVGIETSRGRATVSVIDDGDGVPVEAREAIFEPYGTAGSSSRNPSSVGLGLSVSRTLATLMDGDLRYEWEGGESHFHLVLPLA